MGRETIILVVYAFLLYTIGYECYHCNENLEKLVAVAEQADAPSLGVGTHKYIGSSPVSDINIERSSKVEYTKYEDSKGVIVFARQGLSNPVNENEPFVEGYWIILDSYGSEQFIPKPEFEQNYREVKKPE